MMKFIDISLPIHKDMVCWPGDPSVEIETLTSHGPADGPVVSVLKFGNHTGTHVDAPKHYLKNGIGVDEIPLERLIGPCQVIDCSGRSSVRAEMLAPVQIKDFPRILFRTDNSRTSPMRGFSERFVAIEPDAARILVDRGVLLVGIDGLSVDPYNAETPAAHLALLAAGVVILEGIDLQDVREGRYELICLPLRIKKADGAPARAVLRRLGEDTSELSQV